MPTLPALNLPIRNVDPSQPAFRIRYVVPTSCPAELLDGHPGWRVATHTRDTGWTSRADSHPFKAATAGILHWPPGSNEPLILTLDLGSAHLKGAALEVPKHVAPAILDSVDLIPLQPLVSHAGGSVRPALSPIPALLGFTFTAPVGYSGLVQNVLGLTGIRRKLWRLLLKDRRARSESGFTLAHLLGEAQLALDERRPLALTPKGPWKQATSPADTFVMSVVHVPENSWPLAQLPAQGEAGPSKSVEVALEAAQALLTAGGAGPSYPKYSASTRRFDLPQSPLALYAIHDLGLGALLGPTRDGFNQSQKPRVVMEAHYLQWAIARHLRHADPSKAPALVACFDRENRKVFMKEALDFYCGSLTR